MLGMKQLQEDGRNWEGKLELVQDKSLEGQGDERMEKEQTLNQEGSKVTGKPLLGEGQSHFEGRSQ